MTVPDADDMKEIVKRLLDLIDPMKVLPMNFEFFPIFHLFSKPIEKKRFTSELFYDRSDKSFEERKYGMIYKNVMADLRKNLPEGWEPRFARFILALPIVGHDFTEAREEKTVEGEVMEDKAKVTARASRASFMKKLDIKVDLTHMTEIGKNEIKLWLKRMYKFGKTEPLELSSILEINYKIPLHKKEDAVKMHAIELINPLCQFLQLDYDTEVALHASNSPLVPKDYKEKDIVRPDLAIVQIIPNEKETPRKRLKQVDGSYVKQGISRDMQKGNSTNQDKLNLGEAERIVVLIEFKSFPLFGPLPSISEDQSSSRKFPLASDINISELAGKRYHDIIGQVETSMVAAKTRFGAIFDCHYLILLVFDNRKMRTMKTKPFFNDRGQRQIDEGSVLTIPLKVSVLDKFSECPTMLEALAGFLYCAKTDEVADKFFKTLPIPLVMKPRDGHKKDNQQDKNEDRDESKDKDDSSKKSTGTKSKANVPDTDNYVIDSTPTLVFPGIIQSSDFSSLMCSTTSRPLSAGSVRTFSSAPVRSLSAGSQRPSSFGSSRAASSESNRLFSSGSDYTTASSIALSDRKIPLVKLDYTMDTEVLQRCSLSFAQVYRIKARYLKQFIIDPIEDDEYIVMKIYDPNYPEDLLELYENVGDCVMARYDMEKKCIDMLHEVKKFNSIHLRQKELIVDYSFGYLKPIVGKTILSRYVDQIQIPMNDPSLLRQAQEQLSLIHKCGIIYADLKDDNILVERGTNKVYFSDFNAVKFVSNVDDNLYLSKFDGRVFVKSDLADEKFKEEQDRLKGIFMS